MKVDSEKEEIHVRFDPSYSFIATSGLDKRIRLYDLKDEQCLFEGIGHSDLITAFLFTENARKLVSVAMDGRNKNVRKIET
jgi:WD40 repeat protein